MTNFKSKLKYNFIYYSNLIIYTLKIVVFTILDINRFNILLEKVG